MKELKTNNDIALICQRHYTKVTAILFRFDLVILLILELAKLIEKKQKQSKISFFKVWFKEQGLLEGVVAPFLALLKIEIEEQGLVHT